MFIRNAIATLTLLCTGAAWSAGAVEKPAIKIMTRNVDAGTDLGFLFAATDEASLVKGLAATLAEVKDSRIVKRAAYLAGEIAVQKPDLNPPQEATSW